MGHGGQMVGIGGQIENGGVVRTKRFVMVGHRGQMSSQHFWWGREDKWWVIEDKT